MPSPYLILKRAYKSVLPESVRHGVYLWMPKPLQKARMAVIRMLELGAGHDEIYDAQYYEKFVEPTMAMSATVIAESIVQHFRPTTLVDVGCGTGGLLLALKDWNVQGVGLERSEAALAACCAKGLNVESFDLESEAQYRGHADVVISTEVAEHLPESFADRFVDVLCEIGAHIVLTAATPGQGGTDHVNEQPNSYWIEKVQRRGFAYDEAISEAWRKQWRERGIAACFWNSVMVFGRGN